MNPYLKIKDGPFEGSIDNYAYQFSFEPDDWQKHGFWAIENGENVLVTAHTGCGKTSQAIYAISHFTKLGQKVVYTSPIKTLSNQKYKEFSEKFPDLEIGLMTGDIKINPDADCVIMTTEILRNALYDIGDKDKKKEVLFEDDFLSSIGCVIFDEVHYINDKDRGKVWEETIIMLDPKICLVMLSATIDKAHEFAGWVGKNKQKVINLIPTSHRVVPLEHYIYCDNNIYKVLDKNNKFDLEKFEEVAEVRHELHRPKAISRPQDRESKYKASKETSDKYRKKVNEKPGPSPNTMLQNCVKFLQDNNLLQTIFFSFSRKNCEKFADTVGKKCTLTDHEERDEIQTIWKKYTFENEEMYNKVRQFKVQKRLILKGIAFHHSGLMPILKEIVEILFAKGLIKILFATETFAVGVNMPTKTIVFTALDKYTSEGQRFLTTAEYKQMAGRAGRRGLDKYGRVIILPMYDFPHVDDLQRVMLGTLPSIKSQFHVDYSFVLKIIQSRSKQLTDFIDGSLYKKDGDLNIYNYRQELVTIQSKLESYNFDPLLLGELKGITEFRELEKQLNQSGFKMNKSQNKRKKEVTSILNSRSDLRQLDANYKEYQMLKEREAQLLELVVDTNDQVFDIGNTVVQLLQQFGYITTDCCGLQDITRDNVTVKGIMAAQVNECNAFILTEIIAQDLLNGLEVEEVVAILGCFIKDVRRTARRGIESIMCTDPVYYTAVKIRDIANNFLQCEQGLKYNHPDGEFWEVCYDYIDPCYRWASGEEIGSILYDLDVYEGNFIRSILKIANIAKDLIGLSKVYGQVHNIPVLEQIPELLLRDVVNNDSLYLS